MKLKLDSPIKRIGALLSGIPLMLLFIIIVLWNFSEKPFLYLSNEWVRGSYPDEPYAAKGKFWVRSEWNDAWYLFDNECYEREKELNPKKLEFRALTFDEKKQYILSGKFESDGIFYNSRGEYLFSKKCIEERRGDSDVYEWRSSLEKFVIFIVNDPLFYPLFVAVLLGVLLLLGVPQKLVRWIKTGNWSM